MSECVRMSLSNGGFTLLDREDYKKIRDYSWFKRDNGYIARTTSVRINGIRKVKVFYLHREIIQAPKGFEVHHVNHLIFDNRKENLLVLSPDEHLKIHQTVMI